MEKNLAIIPARMESSRFFGKPLKKILGIPMIGHCYERALLSSEIDDVYISTPNDEIIDWCNNNKINVVKTSNTHKRAIDRVQESLNFLDPDRNIFQKVLMIQGDEPQTMPEDCNKILKSISNEIPISNLILPIRDGLVEDKNIVKAIINKDNNIFFFSRSRIPFGSTISFRQLGLIAFTTTALDLFSSLKSTSHEEIESIDMMRYVENSIHIKAIFTDRNIVGVDLQKNIKQVEKLMIGDKYFEIYKKKLFSK